MTEQQGPCKDASIASALVDSRGAASMKYLLCQSSANITRTVINVYLNHILRGVLQVFIQTSNTSLFIKQKTQVVLLYGVTPPTESRQTVVLSQSPTTHCKYPELACLLMAR